MYRQLNLFDFLSFTFEALFAGAELKCFFGLGVVGIWRSGARLVLGTRLRLLGLSKVTGGLHGGLLSPTSYFPRTLHSSSCPSPPLH